MNNLLVIQLSLTLEAVIIELLVILYIITVTSQAELFWMYPDLICVTSFYCIVEIQNNHIKNSKRFKHPHYILSQTLLNTFYNLFVAGLKKKKKAICVFFTRKNVSWKWFIALLRWFIARTDVDPRKPLQSWTFLCNHERALITANHHDS